MIKQESIEDEEFEETSDNEELEEDDSIVETEEAALESEEEEEAEEPSPEELFMSLGVAISEQVPFAKSLNRWTLTRTMLNCKLVLKD